MQTVRNEPNFMFFVTLFLY